MCEMVSIAYVTAHALPLVPLCAVFLSCCAGVMQRNKLDTWWQMIVALTMTFISQTSQMLVASSLYKQ